MTNNNSSQSPPQMEPGHHLIPNDVLNGHMVNEPQYQSDDWEAAERVKANVIELQKVWVKNYNESREKLLVDMTEKLHQEFLSDQQKIRTELLTQFKDELDTTKMELDAKYREELRLEVAKVAERHRKEISDAKRKQWCCRCENEAMYDCCRNTAYCSTECQRGHWAEHRKYCKRKMSANGGIGAINGQ